MQGKTEFSRFVSIALSFACILIVGACRPRVAPPPPPPPPPPAPTASLFVDPATLEKGQSATLTWQTTSATEVSIDGIGPVAPSGTRQVTPDDSTTYKLTAKGAGGAQEATVRVTVTIPPPPPPPPPPLSEETFDVNDVLFNSKSAEIRVDAAQILTSNARFLNQHRDIGIIAEGHADDTGSTEYNLDLGDRRATAVKNFLVENGVSADRISVISYGKEKPFCTDNTQTCHEENRRVHFASDHGQSADLPERVTARYFLRDTEPEPEGYGLYSYILFSRPPDAARRPAYLKLIQIYLQLHLKEEFETSPRATPATGGSATTGPTPPSSSAAIPRSQLNVTFLPVNENLNKCTAPEIEKRFGPTEEDCILDHAYDYKRSLNLLSKLDRLQPQAKKHTDGPYIVSTLEPIDRIKRIGKLLYINQDLTRVPADVVQDHVNAFVKRAERPSTFTQATIRSFMLGLRTDIALAAGPLDNVLATISLVSGK